MEVHTHYFREASPEHTDKVVQLVREFLDASPEISKIMVATTEGTTGLIVANAFPGHEVIVVTHHTGFVEPNYNELDDETREKLEKAGAKVLTTTHAFAGIGRSLRKRFGTLTIPEIFAIAYRTFGQGTKVCAELALMAADAGLVSVNEDVVCIGGTGRGADTAWVVRPANTSDFPDLRMRACICKPLEF